MRIGVDEFQPDFLLHKPAGETPMGRTRHRLVPIEVKYRASVEEFLQSHGDELLASLRTRWPEMSLVFVTDHPASERSCFQVLDLGAARPGEPLATVDLHYVHDFDVYLTTVREYEGLVRQIFPLLRLSPALARPPGAAS